MFDQDKIKRGVSLILEGIGEDTNREGLLDTPERVARMYEEVLAGYEDDASKYLTKTFKSENSDIVIQKNIEFYSMCEHHMMPFYGTVTVAYIPKDEVVGLSKIARTVEAFAKKLQLQERLTSDIADAFVKHLNCEGVMVVVNATHMCMTMRGIKKTSSKTLTYAARGKFEGNDALIDRIINIANS